MEIQIEATADIAIVDGVECRIWKGTTAGGVECRVLVHRLVVHNDDDSSEFERELVEQMPPAEPPIDLRFLLP